MHDVTTNGQYLQLQMDYMLDYIILPNIGWQLTQGYQTDFSRDKADGNQRQKRMGMLKIQWTSIWRCPNTLASSMLSL